MATVAEIEFETAATAVAREDAWLAAQEQRLEDRAFAEAVAQETLYRFDGIPW